MTSNQTSTIKGPRAVDAISRQVLGIDALLKLVEPRSEAAAELWGDLGQMSFLPPDIRKEELERLRRLDGALDAPRAHALDEHLAGLPSLKRTFRRLEADEVLRDADFFELKRFLFHGLSILRIADGLDSLPSADSELGELLQVIMETIHPEQRVSTRFHLADELDSALHHSREQMRSVRKRYKVRRQMLEKSIISDHKGSFDIRGRFRPVDDEPIDDMRLQRDDGLYRIVDAEMEALADELDAARQTVSEEETRQRQRLTAFVKQHAPTLNELKQLWLRFDLRLAKVELRRHLQGCWPKTREDDDGPPLSIRGGRDPLLSTSLGSDQVQPIDVELNQAGTVVLGPNMGGKSALLRLIGLIQWCAQMAFPVPADECAVLGVDRVVYIGSEEPGRSDVTEGLSSFGREVRRFVDYWDVHGRTLWLLDEPGRGTHPEEGAQLAEEICRRRVSSGDRVVAATHFPQLADADGFALLSIAGLAIDDAELERRLARASDVGESLEAVLRRCMDYRVVEVDGGDVPRDARRVARALGLDLS